MKVKYKLLIFLLLFSAMLVGILATNFYINDLNIELYVENQIEKLNQSANNSIEIKNELIEAIANDYTYWDDVFNFVTSHDANFAATNLEPLTGYQYIDYVWVYNTEAENIYNKEKENFTRIENPLKPEYLFKIFDTIPNSKKRLTNFYFKADSAFYVVYGATIHRTQDQQRLKKPNGFFLLGKKVDDEFLDKLGIITNSKVSLFFDSTAYKNKNKQAIFSINKLYNFEHKYIASLVFEKNDNYISKNKASQKNILLIISIVILLSILLIGFLFNLIVTKPFNSIIKSLNTNSLLYIKNYIDSNNEFGQISKLIEAFFKQKVLLEDEIEERKQIMAQIEEKNEELQLQNEQIKELYDQNSAANEELMQQNEEIQTILDEINFKKEIIEKAHRNITASINYAKSIQEALLTRKELINTFLHEYFLLFKPKEGVSGDFYYINKKEDNLIFAVADCTGHGVPGGFISMLAITYLHEAVRHETEFNSAHVLEVLRERFKRTFVAFGSKNNNGLDIAFCTVNLKTNILQYSGANNPIFIIRNNKLIEYEATKSPIGTYPKERPFENIEIQLLENDLIYLFSDGYPDQFGGEKYRKYTKLKFKEKLIEIEQKALSEQKEILEETLQNWKGDKEQTDDITVMAVRWNPIKKK